MQAEYILNYDVVSRAKEHNLYVMARIKAKTAPQTTERPPLNISVVLDRSGSMAGDKLDYAKKAIEFLVQHMSPKDVFSLVTYDKRVEVNISPSHITNKDAIIQALEKIRAGSTTNLSGGWLQGCNLVAEVDKQPSQINRVLLLSDGLANEGITDKVRLMGMAKQKRSESITTSTMGVGMGFNEDLMTEMANEGGGAFYFIDDPEQAPGIFAEELRGLLNVVAQNLTIKIVPSKDVEMVRQLNLYSSEERNGQKVFLLGDIFSDEEKLLLLELSIPKIDKLGEIQVATMHLEYDELDGDNITHRSLELPIKISMVDDEEWDIDNQNDEVVKQVLLLSAAHARREAMKEADEGNFDTASKILETAAHEIETATVTDLDLQTEQNILREEAVNMELGDQRYDSRTRKTMSSSIAYSTTRIWKEGKESITQRLRKSRQAVERNGETPTKFILNDKEFSLEGDVIVVGRHAGCDIFIDDESISSEHCRVTRSGDDLMLEDLNSSNGTYANGGQVSGQFRLSKGDVVAVGNSMLMAK